MSISILLHDHLECAHSDAHVFSTTTAAISIVFHHRRANSSVSYGSNARTMQEQRATCRCTGKALVRDKNNQCQLKEFRKMDIKRIGSQPSVKGSSDWFTGTVRIDPLFQAPDPALVQGASVTFEPGARTAWHTHPLGQTLIVMAGSGLAQRWGGPIEEIRPGDVVWFSPGEKHWHGATPTTAMTHIAIQEKRDGKVVDWMEKVSDEQYRSR
jgi:quercetin dioxygenase-like cupin family protein